MFNQSLKELVEMRKVIQDVIDVYKKIEAKSGEIETLENVWSDINTEIATRWDIEEERLDITVRRSHPLVTKYPKKQDILNIKPIRIKTIK